MLRIRILGQFELQFNGQPIDVPSRPAQSLLAYLALNAGVTYRRERLAGMLWPDSTETNARSYLRHALWRIRRALDIDSITWRDYLHADDIAICFLKDADYWLDADAILSDPTAGWSPQELADVTSLYHGELLPGFYDEWTVLERERLRASFDQKMRLLLDRQIEERQWDAVLVWAERWIALGLVPDTAYRALMLAHTGIGDRTSVSAVYQRYVAALDRELGLEPSGEMHELCEELVRGETPVVRQPAADLEGQQVVDRPPDPGEPPFKGLEYFDVSDASLYFGREALTARIAEHLRDGSTLAILVGASGSGKSSLVRAGLVPAMLSGAPLADGARPPEGNPDWMARILTPTTHPLRALASSLVVGETNVSDLSATMGQDRQGLRQAVEHLLDGHGTPRLLLVIDQFEELFTQCRHEASRRAFIDNLLAAAAPDGRTTIALALRADFYAYCAAYAGLRQALEDHQFYLGPMSTRELRQAIERPAGRAGWDFQPGLVSLLLRDVLDEPGALPLLSHALLETWHRRSGRTLTLQGYAASGGVHGAIARSAETVYNHRLDAAQQAIARNILLRLTEVGEDAQDTRRRATLAELVPSPEMAPAVEEVLSVLTEARLITLTHDPSLPATAQRDVAEPPAPSGDGATAEVAHEALIREWPTLRGWIDEDRQGLRIHRHLTEAARAWEELSRDPGELYRGVRLTQAREWATGHDDRLNELERDFLQASQRREAERVAEREAQRQRELEAAHQLAQAERRRAEEQARSSRRLRWFAAGLALLLIVALAAGAFAVLQRGRAETETHLAKSRELAAAALSNLETDAELSTLLALAAVQEAEASQLPVPREAEEALHQAVIGLRTEVILRGHADAVTSVAFSPDGRQVTTASADGTARLWDAESGEEIRVLKGHDGELTSVVFHPDGALLATGSADGCAKVWDVATGGELLVLCGHEDGVSTVRFSRDGAYLLIADSAGSARMWDVSAAVATSSPEPLPIPFVHGFPILHADFDPDGSRLVTSGVDGIAMVWDTSTGEALLEMASPAWCCMSSVAFNPDGNLVAGTASVQVVIWDAASGEEQMVLFAHGHHTSALAYSQDGSKLATGGEDRRARVWDAETGRPLLTLAGHTGGLTSVAFDPDDRRLVTASYDGTARIWNLSPSREWLTLPIVGMVGRATFSPDGSKLAVGYGWSGDVGIWDTTSGDPVLSLDGAGHTAPVFSAAFNSGGTLLATSAEDTTAKIWSATTGRLLHTLSGHRDIVFDLVFSPDGTILATAGRDGKVMLWDPTTAENLHTFPEMPGEPRALAFSPDGSRLAAAKLNGYTMLWTMPEGSASGILGGHSDTVEDVAFSPDGSLLATCGGDASIILWDAQTQEQVRRLTGDIGIVMGCEFSPDGRLLASASLDGLARLWDVETGQELLALSGGTGEGLWTITFRPDGKMLAAGDDFAVRLYLTELSDLVALAQSRLSRGLTAEECHRYLRSSDCPAVQASAAD